MRRLEIGAVGICMLCLGLSAAPASATTVYDYTYSGTFIDGSTTGKTFDTSLDGLEYDRANHVIYVTDGGNPGSITKVTRAGVAVNFSSSGAPRIVQPGFDGATISIDQTGGPHDGRFYATGGGSKRAYEPNGTLVPGFEHSSDAGCGIAVQPPDGSEILFPGFTYGALHISPTGELLSEDFVGSLGLKPSITRKWSEFGKLCRIVIDGEGNVYGVKAGAAGEGNVIKMNVHGKEEYELTQTNTAGNQATGVGVDYSNNDVAVMREENGTGGSFELYDNTGRLLGSGFGVPDPVHSYPGLARGSNGVFIDPETHDIWVANQRNYGSGVGHLEKFEPTHPHTIPTVTAIKPGYDDPSGELIKLRGTVDPENEPTTNCHFEYGPTPELGKSLPCEQGQILTGNGDQEVTAKANFKKGARYYYKLYSKNANGQVALSNTEPFIPQYKPTILHLGVDQVNTDGVRFNTEFNSNGGNGTYHFEYGQNGNFEHSTAESDTVGFATENGLFEGVDKYLPGDYAFSNEVTGLTPGETYEYRVAVTNEAATIVSGVQKFTTYVPDPGADSCKANAQERQQTESSLLPDCRAYELVSAPNSGGYDVESDLVAGQSPLDAYPDASGKVLYSVHSGLIPGVAGSPTNLGRDPYIATRDASDREWVTKYVGLPADGMADEGAFGSPLLGADESLTTFAFGGADICAPCFGDTSTNIPVRLPDGSLVEGMSGGLDPSPADPVGEVRRPVSADGSHLIFGSDKKFDGAAVSGTEWIYSHELGNGGGTELVSTTPAGAPIVGEVAELDVSSDGSRVLVGKKVGEDAAHNALFDLYMHIAGNPSSILVEESLHGAEFNGMTADGSQVFFTTADKLADDNDASTDFYRATVGSTSPATVTRLSTGTEGTGDIDSCTPITNWNVASGGPDCDTVALAGGAGVARDSGTAYFISPETLDGLANGTAGQPNLYVVAPGSSTPHFVATIDSSLVKPGPQPPDHPVANANFATALATPEAMTVDQSNGDVYTIERGAERLARFTSAGVPHKFTAGPGNNTNHIGMAVQEEGRAMVAVDNAPGSLFQGSFYVTNGSTVNVYAPSGAERGTLGGGFGEACGVAVDEGSGVVYVADRTNETIWRFAPTAAAEPVTAADYLKTGLKPEGMQPCGVAADKLGNVYAATQQTGPLKRFKASDFALVPPSEEGVEIDTAGKTAMVDPATNDLYVNNGAEVLRYDSAGSLIQKFGASDLGSSSRGVAVDEDTGHVYAPAGETIVEFGVQPIPYEPIDNPAVVHGVRQAAVHSYEDFQVTPDGHYALFSSAVPLTGYQNEGFSEIYRYDAENEQLACPSCAPSGAAGASNVTLTPTGLNLTDDGRVFFTTLEAFTLRDTNERRDAYEWSDLGGGKPTTGLISTGIGQSDSSLLSASADGTDAFFFTRDVLSPKDENGNTVKVYDARAGGGFLVDPPRQPCKASDECHGPGTPIPPPPDIKSQTGSQAPSKILRCGKGKVKRKGKCVKPKHKKHHSKHRNG